VIRLAHRPLGRQLAFAKKMCDLSVKKRSHVDRDFNKMMSVRDWDMGISISSGVIRRRTGIVTAIVGSVILGLMYFIDRS
jgi:hypothetical protein